MAEKDKKLNSPFQGVDAYEGVKDFDTDYLSIAILDKAVPTGDKGDFIVKKVVEITKQPIKEVVAVDADSVGVYNIIKEVMKTGDSSLLPVDRGSGEIVDLVGAPENLMELKQMGVDAENAFASIPDELKGDKDMVSFINSMSQEKFDAFIKAVGDRINGQKETKENE